jgi:DeoD family purine-nucleoside phosphorylase
LPGDPGRALRLAQALLDGPRMFNHHRGLWGYTGAAADGEPLTIQATGMGGPSAAIVVEELARLGVKTVVRVGTCGALRPGLELGDLIVAREVRGEDGASRGLGAPARQAPDAGLSDAMAGAGDAGLHEGTVVSTDLFYDPGEQRAGAWAAAGALAVEMEAAAVLAAAARRGVRAACLLAITDLLHGPGGRERIDEEALVVAEERLGEVAVQALLP